MSAIYDLQPAAQAVVALLPRITEEQLGSATPCEKANVRDLLFHVLGLSMAFRDAARKDFGPTTATSPQDLETNLPEDWREQIPARLDELVEAWRSPEAWDGDTQAGGVDLPGAVAGHVALNELVLHGWDLARATGQPYSVDEATAQASFDLLWPPEDQSKREGMFGPVVEVPEDAPLLDRAVGLSGRDPGWTAKA